jgi:hypothetical protein
MHVSPVVPELGIANILQIPREQIVIYLLGVHHHGTHVSMLSAEERLAQWLGRRMISRACRPYPRKQSITRGVYSHTRTGIHLAESDRVRRTRGESVYVGRLSCHLLFSCILTHHGLPYPCKS